MAVDYAEHDLRDDERSSRKKPTVLRWHGNCFSFQPGEPALTPASS